jgi:hypothetical protein
VAAADARALSTLLARLDVEEDWALLIGQAARDGW